MNTPNANTGTPIKDHAFGAQARAVADAAALIALSASAVGSEAIGDSHHLVIPPGHTHKDISDLVERTQSGPRRKSGTVVLKSVESLLQVLADQARQSEAYVYADPDARTITAVFNDNRDVRCLPGWRDHRAQYTVAFTPEFENWMRHNRQPKDQTAFAEFIEDNFADITEPAAQQLLEVATTIQAKTDISFSSAKRLQDGQVQLGYTETIDARAGANGALQIPKEFALGLRLFKNGPGYKLRARLKYRLGGGAVKFWYELDRPERAIEDAFGGYVATVREKSGYQVLLGAP